MSSKKFQFRVLVNNKKNYGFNKITNVHVLDNKVTWINNSTHGHNQQYILNTSIYHEHDLCIITAEEILIHFVRSQFYD